MILKINDLKQLYLAYYDYIPLSRLSRLLGSYPQQLHYYVRKYSCETLADLIINLIVHEGLVIDYD